MMRRKVLGVLIFGLLVGLGAISIGATASAHVTVKPAEVEAASFQTFTVSVPSEKSVATTQIKVVIPGGVAHVTPTQKAGWTIATEKQGSDNEVTSITWSGAEVAPGFRDDFTFSAQVPATETQLEWRAYQTYADGTVVAWDQEAEGGHDTDGPNTGPFSVTTVVTEADVAGEQGEDTSNIATVVRFALYLSIAAVLLGLVSIFVATRKK